MGFALSHGFDMMAGLALLQGLRCLMAAALLPSVMAAASYTFHRVGKEGDVFHRAVLFGTHFFRGQLLIPPYPNCYWDSMGSECVDSPVFETRKKISG